ncbi:sulfite exporter TauE/SafE family protein [Bacillaceae bacterium W0354]
MDFVFFFIIILVASILQTSTGFGFSIMATPFLLVLFEPAEAIQINLILSLVISCALIIKIQKDVDIGLIKRFAIGSIIGLPIGIIIFQLFNIRTLKFSVGIVILVLTFLLMLSFRIRQTLSRDVVVGGVSGVLTTSIGMPGPPLLLYFSGISSEKKKIRSTTLAFYLFIYLVSLILQISVVGTNLTTWLASGVALPVVILGLLFGQLFFKIISQRAFRIFTYILLIFSGIYLLINSLDVITKHFF